jgi:uncharacterized protein (UPF0248 family)
MQPVQDILHRIQWDEVFAEADFEIGYYDRVEGRIVRVPFTALHFPTDDHFAFELFDASGDVRRIPFHRIREIHRDGRCIWSRPMG